MARACACKGQVLTPGGCCLGACCCREQAKPLRNGRIGSRGTTGSVGLQGRRACGLHSGLPHGIVGTVQPVLGGVAGRGVGLHSPNNPSPGELGAASHSLGSQYLGTCGNPGCGWCMVAGYRQERHGTVPGHRMSIRVHVRGLSHSAQHTGPVRDHEPVPRHARQLHDRGAQQVEKAKPPGTLGSLPQSASPSDTCWAHVRRPWPPATIGCTPEGTSCSAEPHRSQRHCSRSKCQGGAQETPSFTATHAPANMQAKQWVPAADCLQIRHPLM